MAVFAHCSIAIISVGKSFWPFVFGFLAKLACLPELKKCPTSLNKKMSRVPLMSVCLPWLSICLPQCRRSEKNAQAPMGHVGMASRTRGLRLNGRRRCGEEEGSTSLQGRGTEGPRDA